MPPPRGGEPPLKPLVCCLRGGTCQEEEGMERSRILTGTWKTLGAQRPLRGSVDDGWWLVGFGNGSRCAWGWVDIGFIGGEVKGNFQWVYCRYTCCTILLTILISLTWPLTSFSHNSGEFSSIFNDASGNFLGFNHGKIPGEELSVKSWVKWSDFFWMLGGHDYTDTKWMYIPPLSSSGKWRFIRVPY